MKLWRRDLQKQSFHHRRQGDTGINTCERNRDKHHAIHTRQHNQRGNRQSNRGNKRIIFHAHQSMMTARTTGFLPL